MYIFHGLKREYVVVFWLFTLVVDLNMNKLMFLIDYAVFVFFLDRAGLFIVQFCNLCFTQRQA